MKYISKINKLIAVCLSLALLSFFLAIPEASRAAFSSNDELVRQRLGDCVALFIGSPKAYVKGSVVKIDENNSSVKPVVKNDRTLVPIRFISSSFGADVQWDQLTNTAVITLKDKIVQVKLGSKTIYVNNQSIAIDTAAESIGDRIFVPLRALSSALGKYVFWDDRGLIVISSEENVLNAWSDSELINTLTTYFEVPIAYENPTVTTSAGKRSVKVIKVNPKDPSISFEVALPNNRLNQTGVFENLVKSHGAFAAINGNFFSSYDVIKDPIGHVMSAGKLVYMQSGITTVGFTKDKQVIFSKPGTFVTGTGKNGQTWSAFEVNTLSQSPDVSIMYTPERGDSVDIKVSGYIATVVNDVVESNNFVEAPAKVSIPSNGYIVFFGEGYAKSLGGNRALAVGSSVDYTYYIRSNTNSAFNWDNTICAVSGGPDLILNGEICPPSTHPAFTGSRFTTEASLRTAIGVTNEGKLLLVNTPAVKISELKEIMQQLGAVNAVNLDGGASTAMYYDGKVLTKPGRELEAILYVHF